MMFDFILNDVPTPAWWVVIGLIIIELIFGFFIWLEGGTKKRDRTPWIFVKFWSILGGGLLWCLVSLFIVGLFELFKNISVVVLEIIFVIIIYFILNYIIYRIIRRGKK